MSSSPEQGDETTPEPAPPEEIAKPRVRTDRVMLVLGLLVLAVVLGVVGGMNNWYAFVLGEVASAPAATSAVPSPAPTASPSPSDGTSGVGPTDPGATTGGSQTGGLHSEEYKEGRAKGAVDGYQAGRIQGRKDGFKRGKERGLAEGQKDGYRSGYARGYDAGYRVGFARGHACSTPKPFCKSIGS